MSKVFFLIFIVALSGCGKKGDPDFPDNQGLSEMYPKDPVVTNVA